MEIQPGKFPEQSTYLSGELLAKALASLASEEEQTIQEVDLSTSFVNWCGIESQDGLSGKMSPVSCPATEDGILVPSLGRWGNWGMSGPTESWTLNGSEWPKDASVCLLSRILEMKDVPNRFFLNERACAGILRRAEKRKKKLPGQLQSALEFVMMENRKHLSQE